MTYNYRYLDTQNSVLYHNLSEFYQDARHVEKMTQIVAGDSRISLRIIDWFVTNYAKKYFVVYDTCGFEAESNVADSGGGASHVVTYDASRRFKVFNDYKLKLKAYSKKRFDPFCRWERIRLPNMEMETTLGQLNFFKWAIENSVLEYIEAHYEDIEHDMNTRNSNSKRRRSPTSTAELDLDAEADDERNGGGDEENETESTELTQTQTAVLPKVLGRSHEKTRKRREELSVSACKCIKKETVQVLVKFSQ